MKQNNKQPAAANIDGTLPHANHPGLIGRRTFFKLAVTTAASAGLAHELLAQQAAPAQPAQPQPAQPALGYGEPPAIQFQPWPGGTGACLEKLARERGKDSFERSKFKLEPWKGRGATTFQKFAKTLTL